MSPQQVEEVHLEELPEEVELREGVELREEVVLPWGSLVAPLVV